MKNAVAIKRMLLALLVLVLLAGLVAIFGPSEGASTGQTVTFSDGTTMTLKAVTYGTEHRYLGGGWRQRLLSLLPRKLASKLASQQGVVERSSPSVVLWFERVGGGPSASFGQFVLCDASGFGVSASPSQILIGTSGNQIEGWAFDSWPRRERTLALRVYELGNRYPEAKPVGEFALHNPAPANHPVRSAPEPPVTACEGDLSVTLFDLTAGVGSGRDKWKPAANPIVSQIRAGFRIEWKGQLSKEWEIVSVEASDATSKVVVTSVRAASPERDADYVELPSRLFPAEQPWKLRIGLSQRTKFGSDKLWNLRGLRLSNPDLTNTLAIQTNLPAAVLVYAIPPRHSEEPGSHGLYLVFSEYRGDYRATIVNAVDDMGREATVNRWVGENSNKWGFDLHVNTNATSFDMTVALHQTRYVEFLVRPRIMSTNEAAPR